MFPFQKSGNLSFGTDQNEDKVEDDIWMQNVGVSTGVGSINPPNLPSGINSRGRGRRGRRSSASSSNATIDLAAGSSNANTAADERENKKIVHREVERQRRQEMSDLFSSLRSVLPPDYIKGKRSIGDHLAEAVNYIKDLENNVKQLGDKRDQLKSSMESTSSKRDAGGSSSSSTQCPGTVVMVPRLGGLDIEINVDYEDDEFLLSSALQVILEEGLGIASYTSTKVDNTLVHNVACEANDMTSINFDRLHQRLIDLIC